MDDQLQAALLRVGQAALDAAELGPEFPRRAARLLGQIECGELQLNANHEGLRDFTRQLQRMTNRLALSILLAATIVALGLVKEKPTMFKDPVCGKRINRGKAHIVIEHEGVDYFLCCPRCQAEFERAPQTYARPELGEKAKKMARQPHREHRPV